MNQIASKFRFRISIQLVRKLSKSIKNKRKQALKQTAHMAVSRQSPQCTKLIFILLKLIEDASFQSKLEAANIININFEKIRVALTQPMHHQMFPDLFFHVLVELQIKV